MALGKTKLAWTLILLTSPMIPVQAQQITPPIDSPSNPGNSGWASERTINPNPIDRDPPEATRDTPKKQWTLFPWNGFSKSPKPVVSTQTTQVTQSQKNPVNRKPTLQVGTEGVSQSSIGSSNIPHAKTVILPPIGTSTNTNNPIQTVENKTQLSPNTSSVVLIPVTTEVVKPESRDRLAPPILASSPYIPVQMASPVGVIQVNHQVVEKQPADNSELDPVVFQGVPLPPLGSYRSEESHLPSPGTLTGVVQVSGQNSAAGGELPKGANSSGVVFAAPSPSSKVGTNSVANAGNNSVQETFPPTGPSYSPRLPDNLDSKESVFGNQPGWVDPNQSHFYARGEYLLWWMNGYHVPPLVTTGPAVLTSGGAPDGATLDRADTRILFGGNTLSQGALSGVRLTAGWWCDWECSEGIELSGFVLPQQSKNFGANSIQYPQISRPFTDQVTGSQSAQDTTFPGLAVGSIGVHAPSSFWGLEANLRCKLCCGDYCGNPWRIDLITGPRYLNLGEGISITENIQFTNNPNLGQFQNQRDIVNDSFATRNQFIGGQIGIDGQYNWDRWSVEGRAKLGIGDTIQSLVIQGSQTLPDQYGSRNGGLLALQSNIGRYGRNAFSVVPEIGLNLGYKITDNVRATVGYNFLAWTNVLRPGDQINTTLDSSLIPQFPTTPRGSGLEPSVPFKESTFWAQGLTLGIEFRY